MTDRQFKQLLVAIIAVGKRLQAPKLYQAVELADEILKENWAKPGYIVEGDDEEDSE